ncbi:POTRA domain-containing protein [Pigmentibacter sp. JX0631]|uniref:POTRA domain-containing protein n=1 Tax=Pigmentibacter sp. JX0631 TaxID=2976982 RepID=UPI0024699CFF|nr:POTRA domain-containing protein [Pigmentibacter sp. JX0631]WGL59434.1 POTRA domain-containing protein [Pigmentibacter sp. JX0631]
MLIFKKKVISFYLFITICELLLSCTFYSINSCFAQESNELDIKNYTIITPKVAEGMIIADLDFQGNFRTSDDVIENNLELEENEAFTSEKLRVSMQNLKNLQVFSKIDVTLYLDDKNRLIVRFEIEEKWTLLPYFLAGSGGGTSYLVLGLYETNFIGRLYTFNFTYGCKNNNCSTFVYFRNPSVLGSAFNIVSYLTKEHNVFHVYNHDRDILGTFSNQRDMINLFTDLKITPSFFIGLGFLYLNNYISEEGIAASDSENNKNRKYNVPASTSSLALETRLTLGKINYDGLKSDGLSYVTIIDSTLQGYPSKEDNYTSVNSTLLYYKSNFDFGIIPLPKYTVFAMRSNISATSSDVTSQQFFVGGLDKLRGFYDGEFSGKYSWFSNFELRVPSLVTEYIALQHAFFSDVGYAADTFPGIFNKFTGVSVGTGIRILPLKINRVALRFDYAYTLNPFNTFGFNFGLLQFF